MIKDSTAAKPERASRDMPTHTSIGIRTHTSIDIPTRTSMHRFVCAARMNRWAGLAAPTYLPMKELKNKAAMDTIRRGIAAWLRNLACQV